MTGAAAIAAYLVIYTGISYACHKWSPLVAIGGLLLVMAVASAL